MPYKEKDRVLAAAVIQNNWIEELEKSDISDPGICQTNSGTMGKESRDGKQNPRQQCCWEGRYFFDALKAIVTRMMFLAHAFFAVWRVTLVTQPSYWLFSLAFIGLLMETIVILFKRRGQEWSWFQWSIFLYLVAVIPPIWVLQLQMLGYWENLLNNTAISQDVGQQESTGFSVGLTSDDWMIVVQQGLLVVLIIGRWIMPKGDLTREQLSSLLLTHLGTASDIVDFLSILSEPNISRHQAFLYAVLACWTWSLMQFPFVVTSTTDSDEDDDDEQEVGIEGHEEYVQPEEKIYSKYFKKLKLRRKMKVVKNFFETEAWGIFVSVLMQDGPFAVMRLISILAFQIKTYTNYFFTAKNALVLCLQVYRLWSIYDEHQEKKAKDKNLKASEKLNAMYKQSFKSYEIK